MESRRAAHECVAEEKKVYDALGVPENIVHVIGGEGHRFYADDAWSHINAAIEKL